ncbi:uncharacterized protein [Brachionichthys hirsutus]|uniref:uncharacterized protein n=1 Tax=Brachionichthys hirsutus TaxID=412623 RepID=UPI0036045ADF
MQLYGALILFMTLCTASGLRCYTCTATDPKSCTDTKSCAVIFDRCFSWRVEGFPGYEVVTKGCQTSLACAGTMTCCEGDLCNSALPSAPSLILLLVSSAIITIFTAVPQCESKGNNLSTSSETLTDNLALEKFTSLNSLFLTMKLYGVLVLLVTLSAAGCLMCYQCLLATDPSQCTQNVTCHVAADRCATIEFNGFIIKGCNISPFCHNDIRCCKGDLCNSAVTTGSNVLLLLVSSVITAGFL